MRIRFPAIGLLIAELLAVVFLVQAERPATRSTGRSSEMNAPFPHAVTKEEVLENVLHAVRRSRLFERSEFKILAADGNVQARRIVAVSSGLDSVPDYHLIFIDDTAGSPVAAAVVRADGLLGEIIGLGNDDPSIEPPPLEQVTARLRHRFDVVKSEYYFAGNNLTSSGSRFRPLVRAETSEGIVYVTVDGTLYVEDGKRPYLDSIDKETSDLPRKYPGVKWLITTDRLLFLRKAGSLE